MILEQTFYIFVAPFHSIANDSVSILIVLFKIQYKQYCVTINALIVTLMVTINVLFSSLHLRIAVFPLDLKFHCFTDGHAHSTTFCL